MAQPLPTLTSPWPGTTYNATPDKRTKVDPKMPAVDTSGNSYMTGCVPEGSIGTQIAVWKYDSLGNVKAGWPLVIPNPDWSNDGPEGVGIAIATLPGDSLNTDDFYVLAQVPGKASSLDCYTLRISQSGAYPEVVWGTRYNYDTNLDDVPIAIGLDKAGRVYITCTSAGNGTSNDITTIAYDGDTGDELAVHRFNGPANKADAAADMAVRSVLLQGSVTGHVFVTGVANRAATGNDYVTIGYVIDPNVSLLDPASAWTSYYAGNVSGGGDYATSIAGGGTNTSGVYVTGYSTQQHSNGANYDYVTVKYDVTNGAEQWVSIYDGTGQKDDIARRIAVSDDQIEFVVVTGESEGYGTAGMDITTIGINSIDGASEWPPDTSGDVARRYDPSQDPGGGPPNSVELGVDVMVLSAKGDAYVTGKAYNTTTNKYDYVTLRYGKGTGIKYWQVRNQTGDAPMCLGALPYYPSGVTGPCADQSNIYVSGRHAQAGLPALTSLKYGQVCP